MPGRWIRARSWLGRPHRVRIGGRLLVVPLLLAASGGVLASSAAAAETVVPLPDAMTGDVAGLSAAVTGSGLGYFGDALRVWFRNETPTTFTVEVPVGLRLAPADRTVQTMYAAGGEKLPAPPGESSESIKAFCGEHDDGAPGSEDTFTVDGMAGGALLETLHAINDKGAYDADGQAAVWHQTDDTPVEGNPVAEELVGRAGFPGRTATAGLVTAGLVAVAAGLASLGPTLLTIAGNLIGSAGGAAGTSTGAVTAIPQPPSTGAAASDAGATVPEPPPTSDMPPISDTPPPTQESAEPAAETPPPPTQESTEPAAETPPPPTQESTEPAAETPPPTPDADFQEGIEELARQLDQRYYVRNRLMGDPTLVGDGVFKLGGIVKDLTYGNVRDGLQWAGVTEGTAERGTTCEGFCDASQKDVKALVERVYGKNAKLERVYFEEASTRAEDKGWINWFDSFNDENHVLFRVTTPDGKQKAVDFWAYTRGDQKSAVTDWSAAERHWKEWFGSEYCDPWSEGVE